MKISINRNKLTYMCFNKFYYLNKIDDNNANTELI